MNNELIELIEEGERCAELVDKYTISDSSATWVAQTIRALVERLKKQNQIIEVGGFVYDSMNSREVIKELVEKLELQGEVVEAGHGLFFGEHSPDQFSSNDIAALRKALSKLNKE